MKKTLSLAAVAASLIFSSQANAKDGLYLGADLLFANSNHHYQDRSSTGGSNNYNGTRTHDNSVGFALDAGYKVGFNQFFVAPEIFFDQLNNSSSGFRYKQVPGNKQDTVDLNYRYGAKLNLGYDITPKFNLFVNYGLANVDYDTRGWYAGGRKSAATELAQIYGFGLGYKITENVSARLSYDRQSMHLRNTSVAVPGGDSARYKSTLDVVKLGAVYSF